MALTDEYHFSCPYCGSDNSLLLEIAEGQFKEVQDCEICCRPILINLKVKDEEILDIRIEAENV